MCGTLNLLFSLLISVGPWVTQMRTDGFSVLWTSDEESIAFVELSDGSRHYDEFAGRRIHSRLHRIHLTGFEPGTEVPYSIGECKVVDKSNPRRPQYGEEVLSGPYRTRTFDPSKKTCKFSIFNDIHMDTVKYRTLLSSVDTSSLDFIFLNGDLVNAGHHSVEDIVRYEIAPLGDIPSHIPVMFARGNHEGRGDGVKNVSAVFPNDGELPFTYIFREGPVAFLVIDVGETGYKNSLALSGKRVYEDYIKAQLDWAEKAVKCSEWRSARRHIILCHVPSYDYDIPDDFVAITWMARNALPVLNKLNIDLMINADLHEYKYVEVGETGNSFPMIVNDNDSRVDVSVCRKKISVDIYSVSGDHTHSFVF